MLRAFGDSFTAGEGVTNPFVATVGRWFETPYLNKGVGGSQIQDQAVYIHGAAFSCDDTALFLTGFNDMRYYGENSATYAKALLALLAWMGTSDKVSGRQATQSGTWADTPVNSIGRYSNVVGSRISACVTGKVVYIGSIIQTVNPNGTFRVKIDDVDYGVYSCQGSSVAYSLRNDSPYLIRIDGLCSGSHRVEIEVLTGLIFIDWIGAASPGQRVLVGECCRMKSASYGMWSPFNKGSDAIVDQYRTHIQSACSLLAADGLRIESVPVRFDPDAQVQPDQVHPTENGQATIAVSFISKMSAV